MTKAQKIWLGVFLAMFIIPEILWSPILNSWYAFNEPTVDGSYQILRNNFLHNTGNSNLWSNIILFQFFGLLLTIIYLFFIRRSFKRKYVFWVMLGVTVLVALFVFGVYSISTIHINFSVAFVR